MGIQQLIDRFKYGQPIVIVSGLPRSGTSMMMKMIVGGGLEPVQDGIREADPDNPKGYFELERVKDLDKPKDKAWVTEAKGKVLKVISFLLRHLPSNCRYKIVFLNRNIDEVIASQNKMLVNRGEPMDPEKDAQTKLDFQAHLKNIEALVRLRSNFEVLYLNHRDVIENPAGQAEKVNRFLGGGLDVAKMAEAVDPTLYRNRAE